MKNHDADFRRRLKKYKAEFERKFGEREYADESEYKEACRSWVRYRMGIGFRPRI